jgi:hypothetical protein
MEKASEESSQEGAEKKMNIENTLLPALRNWQQARERCDQRRVVLNKKPLKMNTLPATIEAIEKLLRENRRFRRSLRMIAESNPNTLLLWALSHVKDGKIIGDLQARNKETAEYRGALVYLQRAIAHFTLSNKMNREE